MKNKIAILTLIAQLVFISNSYAQIESDEEIESESSIEYENKAAIITEESDSLDFDNIDYSEFYTTAVIQALNKITAKSSRLEIKVGESVKFGKITIYARKCWKSPPDQMPESKILLEIFDDNSGKSIAKEENIFYGWMFSSTPSISDLEHPIYDITALGCK